jgi:hypothetical protein
VSRYCKLLLPFICALLLNACSRDVRNNSGRDASTQAKQSSPKTTSLTYEDRKAWRAILQWPDSCETGFDSREGTWSGLTFWPIGPKGYLIEVQCFLAAYQANNMYAWYDGETQPPSSKFLTFTVYLSEDGKTIAPEEVTELNGLSEFDAKQRELQVTTKSRGLGDCGSFARYEIQNGAAILKEFRAKFQCDGKWQEPKTYDRLFPH